MFKFTSAKRPWLPIAGMIVAAFSAGPANAALEIELQSDGSTYTQSGSSSPLIVNQSIGNFTSTAEIGSTTAMPSIDLSSVDVSSSAGGTLVVTFSANGFTSPEGAASWLSQFSGNFIFGSATVTQQTYVDNTNTLLGTGTALSTLTSSTVPFGLSGEADASTSGPFAITEVLTITALGGSQVSLDASTVYAPEPASLVLMGAGMLGLAAFSRRRGKV
jgi:PEP-CTERM motif